MANILLHLAKLRIPMPADTVNLVLRASVQQARSPHDISLSCFAAAMLLADHPDMHPTLQPALVEVVNAAADAVNALTPDDARQLLTLHHTVAMLNRKQDSAEVDDTEHGDGLLPAALLQHCRALQQQRARTPSFLQTALIDMVTRVPGVQAAEAEHAPLDGIIRMAAVCRLESGELVGLHTRRIRPAFRNTTSLDGPAHLRTVLLEWRGLRVAQLHGGSWLRLDEDERLAVLTKAVLRRHQTAAPSPM